MIIICNFQIARKYTFICFRFKVPKKQIDNQRKPNSFDSTDHMKYCFSFIILESTRFIIKTNGKGFLLLQKIFIEETIMIFILIQDMIF